MVAAWVGVLVSVTAALSLWRGLKATVGRG